MKLANLIKALEKAGCKIDVVRHRSAEQLRNAGCEHVEGDIWHYLCENNKVNSLATMKCDWYITGSEDYVDTVQVMAIYQNNDIMTDYFPGRFCDTIKRIVKMMMDS